MKRYSFTVLLGISLAIAIAIKGTIYVTTWAQSKYQPVPTEIASASIPEKIEITRETETSAEISTESVEETFAEAASESVAPETPAFVTADRDYFSDALFVGDSRTIGLYEYGDLGKADVFASTGMTVFEIFNTNLSVRSAGKTTLEELLTSRTYGKIYIMLGINEMGYPYESIVKKYQSLVDTVRRLQPEAIIFLQANLHVTKQKSQSNPTYSNEKIDRLNSDIQEMAKETERMYYLDVNPLFDDGEGNLSESYTSDNAHVLGKYYVDWTDWLLTNAVE